MAFRPENREKNSKITKKKDLLTSPKLKAKMALAAIAVDKAILRFLQLNLKLDS